MSWVVDTCLLIEVAGADPAFGGSSARLLDARRPEGLVRSPVSYVERAPMFAGDRAAQDEFLIHLDCSRKEPWTELDTWEAHAAWHRHVNARRGGGTTRRPIADILIGALACRFDGLLTRNEDDSRRLFPRLSIVVP